MKTLRIYFFFLLFVIGLIYSFIILRKSNISINDGNLTQFLIDNNYDVKFKSVKLFNDYKPIDLLNGNYFREQVVYNEEINPIIYIYNSHQTEEYISKDYFDYSIQPTVMMADYILEDVFSKNKYYTLVEERSIKDILNSHKWNYVYSYDASRILLEDSKKNNNTLKYFIDVHRDSLNHDKTYVSINGLDYANTIFLIGLENPNYKENLEFTEKINNIMNNKYPGLSKGIYKKGGVGVNGVYNQDFSPYTILIEIGGVESTVTEVLNSTLAFSECFMEAIKNEKGAI